MRIPPLRISAILAIVLFSLGLHMYAVNTLRVDTDEPVYFRAAVNYSQYLRDGRWKYLAFYSYNNEHPAFNKIIYGTAMLLQPPIPNVEKPKIRPWESIQTAASKAWILTGRYTATLFAISTTLALSLVNPLAGFLFSIQSTGLKYTSEIYLESLPLLTSFLAALAYLAWLKRIERPTDGSIRDHLWLAISAGLLGITAASKYVYCAVAIAIILHFIICGVKNQNYRRYIPWMLGWGALSLAAFFVFDPYLWKQPFVKIAQTVQFYFGYTGSVYVTRAAYPVYQPLVWLSSSYPQLFPVDSGSFLVALDLPISLLACIGIFRLYRKNPFFLIWLVTGLVILMAWPTKWTQYVLIILVPLCLSASEGLRWLLSFPLEWWRHGRARQLEKPDEI